MWKMWGVLSIPNDPKISAKIYGIYTSLNQAIKAIRGTDNMFEYTFDTTNEDQMVIYATLKTNPDVQITYFIKEYSVDV